MCRLGQQGFSLPDVLLAVLLFSMTLLGLLRYQQVLLQQLTAHRHQQQAWLLAQSALEGYQWPQSVNSLSLNLPQGWQHNWQQQSQGLGCQMVTVTVTPPLGKEARLTRWFCGSP